MQSYLNKGEDAFPDQPKIGDKFGPSYSTQMFRVELAIPCEWLAKDPQCEIHFIWNGNCEASLYNPKTGKHLSAITENVREVYHIKDGKNKNDLDDPGLVVSNDGKEIRVCYLLEMAC